MKILAVEFSSPLRSVAVGVDGRVPGDAAEAGAQPQTRALELVEQALRHSGLEREAIECVAVGLGPGSYTGIRAAISLAQGWQCGAGVRLLGVSSVECLAAQAQAEGMRGKVRILIDAQRNEFYLAGYLIEEATWRVLEPLRLATLTEAQELERAGEVLIGPEVTRWFPEGRVVFPHARTLAGLAAGRNDFISGDKLEPIYLRETAFVKAPKPRARLA